MFNVGILSNYAKSYQFKQFSVKKNTFISKETEKFTLCDKNILKFNGIQRIDSYNT